MKEVKELFIQGGFKDICHSPLIGVTFKIVSWNVT